MSKMIAFIIALAVLAGPALAQPAGSSVKPSELPRPGDAGKSGSAAGMTNGTGSRQPGAAGQATHGVPGNGSNPSGTPK